MTLVILLSALAGCTRFTVHTDYDRSASFAGLHTYAWRSSKAPDLGDPRYNDTLVDARIRTAVHRVLSLKGYVQGSGGADFLLDYHIIVQDMTDAATVNEGYGYGVTDYSSTSTHDFEKGTLLLDIIDPKGMKLMWRGSATAIIDPTTSVESRERRINEAVDKILKSFPPQP